jgi:uncharacterized protein HemX
MMDPILEALLQTGAMGLIAYLLIQYQREQAQEHRDELKALLVQTTLDQETQSREHREQLQALVENNTMALNNIAVVLEKVADKLDALEDKVNDLSHRVTREQNYAHLRDILCSTAPHLSQAADAPLCKEDNDG